MEERFKIRNPELEAEIYYLTTEEGGRSRAVLNGYRGQFYYDERNWDAPQEFVDKDACNPGETVAVKLQTLSPNFHVGRFWVGKKFETREGARIVGHGRITKVIKAEFKYWDYESVIKDLPKDCTPYDKKNIKGFVTDVKFRLESLAEIKKVYCKVNLSNQDEMIVVNCKIVKTVKRLRPTIDNICKSWRTEISLKESKFKTEIHNDKRGGFELSFITWDTRYLTGKIIFEI